MWIWPLFAATLAAAPHVGELHLGRLHDPERIRTELNAVLGGATLVIDDYRTFDDADKSAARGDAALHALAETARACELKVVDLRTELSAAGLGATMPPCFQPEVLHMLEMQLDDAAAAALAAQPWVAGLKTLHVRGDGLTSVGVRALLARARAVQDLTVRAGQLGADGAAAVAAHADHLVKLDLSVGSVQDAVPLGDAGIAALLAMPWPLVEELTLEGAELHDLGLLALQRAALPRLKTLRLGHAPLSTAALTQFGRDRSEVTLDLDDRMGASAWSVARAQARRNGDTVDVGVVLARDVDVRALAGVRVIAGDLQITGDVTDLTALRNLEAVKGSVEITGTTHLRSLRALATLTQVDGDLEITRNLALTNTAGLSGLRHVGGGLVVGLMKSGNPGLREVAFPALETVGGSLGVRRGKGYIFPPRKGAPAVEVRVVRPFKALRRIGDSYSICTDEPRLCPALEPPDAGQADAAAPNP